MEKLIGLVSKNYKLVSYEQAKEFTDEILDIANKKIKEKDFSWITVKYENKSE